MSVKIMSVRASLLLYVGLVVATSATQNGPPSIPPEPQGYWVWIPGTTPSPYEEVPKPSKNSYYPIQFSSMSGTNRPTNRAGEERFEQDPQNPENWSSSRDSGPQPPQGWSRSENWPSEQRPQGWSRSENWPSEQPSQGWSRSENWPSEQRPQGWSRSENWPSEQRPQGWSRSENGPSNEPQNPVPQQRSSNQILPGSDFENDWTQASLPLSRAEPTNDQRPEGWGVGNGRLSESQQNRPNSQQNDNVERPKGWDVENGRLPNGQQNEGQLSRPSEDQNPNQSPWNQQSQNSWTQSNSQQNRPNGEQNTRLSSQQNSQQHEEQNPGQWSRPSNNQNQGTWAQQNAEQQNLPSGQSEWSNDNQVHGQRPLSQSNDNPSLGQQNRPNVEQRSWSPSNPTQNQGRWNRANNDDQAPSKFPQSTKDQSELSPKEDNGWSSGSGNEGLYNRQKDGQAPEVNSQQSQQQTSPKSPEVNEQQAPSKTRGQLPKPTKNSQPASTQNQDAVVQEVPDWNQVENKPAQSDKTDQPESPAIEHESIRAEPRRLSGLHQPVDKNDNARNFPVGKYTEPLYENSPRPKPRPVWP